MRIPNADRAVVDIRKLTEYCLNPGHGDGRHKARLFATKLGLTVDDAAALRGILLEVVRTHDAELGNSDSYGQRYRIDFELEWSGRRAIVRSAWIVEHDIPTPRLLSCYPLKLEVDQP